MLSGPPSSSDHASIRAQAEQKDPITESPAKPININSEDYEAKYPEDEYLQEVGSGARVWRVYLDEMRAEDDRTLKGWRETVDVLLVFAALFSAVVTTFVVQSSQALQQNYTQVTVFLLAELIAIQRTQAAGGEVSKVPPSSLNSTSTFRPDPLSTWVNGLWFISLSLSLSVALISVLIKQWLLQYSQPDTGSPYDRVKLRQFRFIGLQKWWVPAIVGSLPVLLHLSLLVFFAGLVLFLHPLNVALPWVILGLAGISYFIYFITPLMPLKDPQCPYKSPLTEVFGESPKFMSAVMLVAVGHLARLFELLAFRVDNAVRKVAQAERWLQELREKLLQKYRISVREQEECAIKESEVVLTVRALEDLRSTSSNVSLHNITLEAYSGLVDKLEKDNPLAITLEVRQLHSDLEHSFLSCFQFEERGNAKLIEGKERRVERLARALLGLQHKYNSKWGNNVRQASCWNYLQENGDPQSMVLALLAKSAGVYLHQGYEYVLLNVEDEAFFDVCLRPTEQQLCVWAWNRLQEQVIRRNLRDRFANKHTLFAWVKGRVESLPSTYETPHSSYIILVLHSLGCPLLENCPELRLNNRKSNTLLIHALVGMLDLCDRETLPNFCQHLYKMIVEDLDWFQGEETDGSDSTTLFKEYQENLLAKLEEEFESEFRRADVWNLAKLSFGGTLVIPELCFELHHRIRPNLWKEDLMRKAVYCLAAGWPLTRSLAQFLIDSFETGAHSSAVELFEEYNGLKSLLDALRPSDSSDKRERILDVLTHYYTAVAQKSPEISSRIFKADFGRLKKLEFFPEVIKHVYQLLQAGWLTNYHRITELRKLCPPSQTQRYNFESFCNWDLATNFCAILDMYENYNNRNLWRFITKGLSSINKSEPPFLCMRPQFISTFEAIENLKRKIDVEGPVHELCISVEKTDVPVTLAGSRIAAPCAVKYSSGMFNSDGTIPVVSSDAIYRNKSAEDSLQGTAFNRPGKLRGLSMRVKNYVGNRKSAYEGGSTSSAYATI